MKPPTKDAQFRGTTRKSASFKLGMFFVVQQCSVDGSVLLADFSSMVQYTDHVVLVKYVSVCFCVVKK